MGYISSAVDTAANTGSTGVENVGELLANLAIPFALGTFVTFVLLAGEFVFERILEKKTRTMVCVLSDLLFGPVTVIAFFQRDSFSTMLFFAIVWHFLCDLDIKPSFIFVMPTTLRTNWQRIYWFQCFWKMLHHLATAVIKFGMDMGELDGKEKFGDRGNVAPFFFGYLTGTSMIHLSTALSHFGATKTSTAMLTLALSLKLGMGACMWIVFWPTQSPWRYLGLTDNVWTTVYILLFVIQGQMRQPDKDDDENSLDMLPTQTGFFDEESVVGLFSIGSKATKVSTTVVSTGTKREVKWFNSSKSQQKLTANDVGTQTDDVETDDGTEYEVKSYQDRSRHTQEI